MLDSVEWLNFRWGLDVSYTRIEQAPILAQLIKKNKNFFWHDGYCYKIQAEHIILRWPEWRNNYRVDMEKVRVRHHQSHKQKKLTKYTIESLEAKERLEEKK